MNGVFLFLAAVAVRNPFWPIGFNGPLESITAEPRIVAKASVVTTNVTDDTTTAAAAAALVHQKEDSQSIQPRHWSEARKKLRITGMTSATDVSGKLRQCALINGFAYGNGDLISVSHDGRRFTWRVDGLTPGESLRLVRVRARELDEDTLKEGSKK